jgi:hypothetical protein
MTKYGTLIYLAATPWAHKTQREQHLIKDLSDYFNIVYIERISIKTDLQTWIQSTRLVEMGNPSRSISIVKIPSIPLFSESSSIPRWYYKNLSKLVEKYANHMYDSNRIIIGCGHSKHFELYRSIDANVKYYDYMDNRPELEKMSHGSKKSIDLMREHENIMEKNSDIIFMSSVEMSALF